MSVCFCSGTLIRTTKGDVAVEDLRVGDTVITAYDRRRPIKWIGHREVDCRVLDDPSKDWPIRIAAHAHGVNRPARDLFVSPFHRILVGEQLIPARSLVNGTTITQVERDVVTYWHVELESHGVLLANNLPAESYEDRGNRGFFAGADAGARSSPLPVRSQPAALPA